MYYVTWFEAAYIYHPPFCRYDPVEDRSGLQPHINEEYECCTVTSTALRPLEAWCKNSNTNAYYPDELSLIAPTGCRCSSNSPCSRR